MLINKQNNEKLKLKKLFLLQSGMNFVQQRFYFFYNTFIEIDIQLVDEQYVTSFLWNLQR